MAEPVTIFMGATQLLAGAAQSSAGRAQAKAENIATEQKIQQHTDEILNLLGRQQSIYTGAGGVTLTGSAARVIEDTRKKGIEDIKRLKEIGATRAQSLLQAGNAAAMSSFGRGLGMISSAFPPKPSTPPTPSTPSLLGPPNVG